MGNISNWLTEQLDAHDLSQRALADNRGIIAAIVNSQRGSSHQPSATTLEKTTAYFHKPCDKNYRLTGLHSYASNLVPEEDALHLFRQLSYIEQKRILQWTLA